MIRLVSEIATLAVISALVTVTIWNVMQSSEGTEQAVNREAKSSLIASGPPQAPEEKP